MGKWHFVHVRCDNGHVMIGAMYSTAATSSELAIQGMTRARQTGTESGLFKGKCGRCGSPNLSVQDLDTGFDEKNAAEAFIKDKIEEWRADRLN